MRSSGKWTHAHTQLCWEYVASYTHRKSALCWINGIPQRVMAVYKGMSSEMEAAVWVGGSSQKELLLKGHDLQSQLRSVDTWGRPAVSSSSGVFSSRCVSLFQARVVHIHLLFNLKPKPPFFFLSVLIILMKLSELPNRIPSWAGS